MKTVSHMNLIYVLNFTGCNHNAVDETNSTLRRRVTIHKEQIALTQFREMTLSEQIDKCARNKIFTYFQFVNVKLPFPFHNFVATKIFYTKVRTTTDHNES